MSAATLRGKIVLLTGASSGIGWETARALSAAGARLALVARRADKLEELVRLCPGSRAYPFDVSDAAGAAGLVARVEKDLGPLDVLINNAGVASFARFEEQDLDDVERLMRVNYLGAAALMRAALPGMLARRSGHVVNVASIAGLFGMPYIAAYAASKFALVGLTEAMRREHYGSGVDFTAFCPGTVETPMTSEVLADETLKRSGPKPKSAAEIARAILRCCERRPREVVIGEAPGFLVHAARFIPGIADWATHRVVSRLHPAARKARK